VITVAMIVIYNTYLSLH